MLPREVAGHQYPSAEALAILSRQDISPQSKIIISRRHENQWYETEVDNVIGYDINEDRQFGASSLTLHCTNDGGLYSYAKADSPHNTLYAHDSESIVVDLSAGQFDNTKIDSGALIIDDVTETGEWTSEIIYGGFDFHSWRKMEWNIDPGKFIRGNSYYGAVNIFVRFGQTLNTNDSTWSVWQKVYTVTGETSNYNSQEFITSTSSYIQIRVEMYPAFETESPTVYGISLIRFKNVGKNVVGSKPLYYYGNKIKVVEYIMNSDASFMEPFTVFSGFIDEANPTQSGGNIGLSVQALDYMKICLGDYIEKPIRGEGGIFESKKTGKTKDGFDLVVTNMELRAVKPNEDDDLFVHPEEVNSVYRVPIAYRNNGPIRGFEASTGPKGDSRGDYLYQPWAERPTPLIYVEDDNGKFVAVDSGYQIDFERGAVYFNEIQVKPDDTPRKVRASFSWYDMTTNLFEDVVGEIIASAMVKFGYKKPIQRKEDGYDIWESPDADAPKIILEHSNPRTVIPPTGYNIDDRKTFFDAIADMLRYVTPDYMVRATPEGNFIGEYRPQQATADYRLTLIEEMDAPVSEDGIYTRCIARGINPSVVNIAPTMKMTPNRSSLVNGNYSSNVLMQWRGSGSDPTHLFPLEFVRFEARGPIYIGSVSALIGEGTGPPYGIWTVGDTNLKGVEFDVEVSTDGVSWFTLAQRKFSGSTNQWVHADKSSFYPDVREMLVKYMRIMITKAHLGKWGGIDGHRDHWQWAMREFQIYENEEIRKEVTIFDLVDARDKDGRLIYNVPRHVAEDMHERLGEKTIPLPIDATLKNEEMVKSRALDYLYETSRNLYKSEAALIYAPHVRVGHTVALTNPNLVATQRNQTVGRRLYYVDSVRRSMDGGVPSVSVSLVSWT